MKPVKLYTLDEAVKLAKQTNPTKFDATVELHINLNVDPRQADQNIRDSVLLPAGSGKKIRVAVLTDNAADALKAGAGFQPVPMKSWPSWKKAASILTF